MRKQKPVQVMVEGETRERPFPEQNPDGVETRCSGEDFNPELAEILYRSLGRWMDLGSGELEAELRSLERNYGNPLYSELIYLLSHLRFPGSLARSHWREIVNQRAEMERKLGSVVDLRVALASYFVQVNRRLLAPRILELQLFEKTQALAYRDELTGLPNNRFFSEFLDREILRARRSNQPMSLVVIDLDSFRDYNERHGREAGNLVLSEVARMLTASLRDEDLLARYGGEEFAMILPATHKAGARLLAERAREAIAARDIPHEGNDGEGRITVSMGIATCPGDADDAFGLSHCAERALFEAKSGGRNQVQIHERNRRSFRRVDVQLRGKCCAVSAAAFPLTTVNLSEGGVRFVADECAGEGSLVELLLDMPSGRPTVTAVGRVVRSVAAGDGWETSVRIVALETEDRLAWHRFIGDMRHRTGADQDSTDPDSGLR